MRVPLSWLRELAPVEGTLDEIAAALDDLGLVVEGIERLDTDLGGVVVGRITSIAAIDGAEKIRRVNVDAGRPDPVEVVCGAWNIHSGDLVPLATVGSTLPGGLTISRRKMKGVVSDGMLCSAAELALGDDAEGILLLGALAGVEVGTPVVDALSLAGDAVFDLSVEGNRPDALSVAGIARDLAARLHVPFRLPEPSVAESGPPARDLATIAVTAPELCPRFTARVLTGVAVGSSPWWMARRLVLAGMRPINAVVDISNYVMLELGQPNHPYDLDLLAGRGIRVRAAARGETLVTLDGQERRLGVADPRVARGAEAHDCMICDGEDAPIGIAGIMGGAATEIRDTTAAVLLETAYFDPMAIARTSKRTGMRTEASIRFERGCDPAGIERAAARFCELAATICGPDVAVAPGIIDVSGEVPTSTRLRLRTARVNAILGTSLGDAEIASYLDPIGLACERRAPGEIDVGVPTYRPDVTREIDAIEEVARHHGLSRIARTRPVAARVGRLDGAQRLRRQVREIVCGIGADEAWTSSLLAHEDHGRAGIPGADRRVANPLAREASVLRRSLLPGLLGALAFNTARRQESLRLFEVGRVFLDPRQDAEPGRPEEREHCAVALARDGDGAEAAVEAWRTLAGALGVAGVDIVAVPGAGSVPGGLHPARSGALVERASGARVGAVGEVDPDVVAAFDIGGAGHRIGWLEVDLGLLAAARRPSSELRIPSRFPSSDVDLAFEVEEEVPAAVVEATLAEAGGDLLIGLRLFDVYRGPALSAGKRSLAWRLQFCAEDRTLTDAEVGEARRRCVDAVERAHPAHLRG